MARLGVIVALLAVLGFGGAFAIARATRSVPAPVADSPRPVDATGDSKRIPALRQPGAAPSLRRPARRKRSHAGTPPRGDSTPPSDTSQPQPPSPSPSTTAPPRSSPPRRSTTKPPSNNSNNNDGGHPVGGG